MSFREAFKKHKAAFIALLIPLGLAALVGLVFLGGLLIQWLWAVTISDIFGVKEISYWQAIGLLVLCKILFGHSFNVTNSRRNRENKKSKHYEFHCCSGKKAEETAPEN